MAIIEKTAKKLVAPGKGILAADESFETIEKRFDSIAIPSTEENRQAYRELLFTTEGVEEFISGVILFDETIHQKASDGVLLAKHLEEKGILPGIKVDQGKEPMPSSPDEMLTVGLEGLGDRLKKYKEYGAKFTKWRAVISITDQLPTEEALQKNAERLAEYAKICQDHSLVPIVEPEVLMDGSHDISRCEEVTKKTLEIVFAELEKRQADLEGMLLKPNMILPGKDSPQQVSVKEIAEATVRTLQAVVPDEVPGIVFLSGGQGPAEATMNLNEMNKLGKFPWELSFSYGRALQEPVLNAWQGKKENIIAAQKAFYHRAKLNSQARNGSYEPEYENPQKI